jgi:predicted PurR-regulated permease PerM
MLGIDHRALRITWTVFLFCFLLLIIYEIRKTLLVFAAAIFFAYMLYPLVKLVSELIPRRRTIALAIVYVLLVGALVGIGFALIPAIAGQASSLLTRLPTLLTGGRLATLPLPQWLDPMRSQIVSVLNRGASDLGSRALPVLQQAGTRLLSGVGLILPMVLIPILAFFFLKDGVLISKSLLGRMEGAADRRTVRGILNDINTVLQSYIRALVILSLVTFAVFSLFLKIVGVEYQLLLAGAAAVLEFIPVIGPAIGLVIILIVAAVTSTGNLITILVFWGVYRLFQDYILNPYLMRAGLELHPLLVLFGVLAGDQIGGIPGMFFSVPVLAILRVVYGNLKEADTRKQISAA